MYSAEFKHGAVEQTKQHGVSCAQVARELGIRENLRAFMALEVSLRRDGARLENIPSAFPVPI